MTDRITACAVPMPGNLYHTYSKITKESGITGPGTSYIEIVLRRKRIFNGSNMRWRDYVFTEKRIHSTFPGK